MVTSTHEGMHRIFQERPEILAPVFEVLEVPLSGKATVDAVTTDVTETRVGNTPAGKKWQEIMSFVSYFPGRGTVRETAYLEGKAEGTAEGKAHGQAAGEAKGVLLVLEVRDIPVPDSVRERITTCTDLDRMDTWLERSRTVERAEDLFAEDPDTPGTSPEDV
ncbi:hypothetical protein ACIRU8_13395 [Streptomyces sp. NPDC101175]|uniref:hypothetical protein n=1 Tax=Streptomyces sp. NPDC101175 TaxID=3366123 RepID=UPI0038373025